MKMRVKAAWGILVSKVRAIEISNALVIPHVGLTRRATWYHTTTMIPCACLIEETQGILDHNDISETGNYLRIIELDYPS